jgi:Fur family transcriptional regulator, zinc uptake regulator
MTRNGSNGTFPSPKHNHAHCIDHAIQAARNRFTRRGMPFTPLRERVFREIAASHQAIGAYEVMNRLAAKGKRLSPISAYRVIEALVEVGVVRRFKSRNAFYASINANPVSQRIVLACQECGQVGDTDGTVAFGTIGRAAASNAFSPRSALIEVFGVCGHCAKTINSAAQT